MYLNTKMVISAASDGVKCRMFSSTFKLITMAWFPNLPLGSISYVKIEDSMPDACIGAFKNGVRPGSLNNKLGRKSASSMTEIRARVHMYILEEEDDALKR